MAESYFSIFLQSVWNKSLDEYIFGWHQCLSVWPHVRPSHYGKKESLVALEGADERGGVLVLDVELLRAAQHLGDRVGDGVEEQLDGDVDEEEEGEEQEHADLES